MGFRNTTIEFVYFFVKVGISSIYFFLNTEPPPLLDAIATLGTGMQAVKRESMIAEATINTDLFGDILLGIHGLHIGFQNATSGFQI